MNNCKFCTDEYVKFTIKKHCGLKMIFGNCTYMYNSATAATNDPKTCKWLYKTPTYIHIINVSMSYQLHRCVCVHLDLSKTLNSNERNILQYTVEQVVYELFYITISKFTSVHLSGVVRSCSLWLPVLSNIQFLQGGITKYQK